MCEHKELWGPVFSPNKKIKNYGGEKGKHDSYPIWSDPKNGLVAESVVSPLSPPSAVRHSVEYYSRTPISVCQPLFVHWLSPLNFIKFSSAHIPTLKQLKRQPFPEHINQPTNQQTVFPPRVMRRPFIPLVLKPIEWTSGHHEAKNKTYKQNKNKKARNLPATRALPEPEPGRGSTAAERDLPRPIDQAMAPSKGNRRRG
jgi:hypothetical protein